MNNNEKTFSISYDYIYIHIYIYTYIYIQIKFSYYSPTELKSKNGPNVSLNQYKYSWFTILVLGV